MCSFQAKLGSSVTVMAKEGLHPEYFPESKVFQLAADAMHRGTVCVISISDVAQVYCNGEEVLTTSGTRGEYTVDIWSGNHPFFQGSNNSVILDEGRVNKFNKRFAGHLLRLLSFPPCCISSRMLCMLTAHYIATFRMLLQS